MDPRRSGWGSLAGKPGGEAWFLVKPKVGYPPEQVFSDLRAILARLNAVAGVDDLASFVVEARAVAAAYEANYRDGGATLAAACGRLAQALKVKRWNTSPTVPP